MRDQSGLGLIICLKVWTFVDKSSNRAHAMDEGASRVSLERRDWTTTGSSPLALNIVCSSLDIRG
jgi:hypothetical protein